MIKIHLNMVFIAVKLVINMVFYGQVLERQVNLFGKFYDIFRRNVQCHFAGFLLAEIHQFVYQTGKPACIFPDGQQAAVQAGRLFGIIDQVFKGPHNEGQRGPDLV
ncbi:hypothetical protein D3C86_1806410 [compost metagenome]